METIEQILGAMGEAGAVQLFTKSLAANDNSKNQVYFGPGFGALNIFPHGDVVVEAGPQGGAVRPRRYAGVRFFWLNENGIHVAPDAKLILYQRYPEVRLSGFLAKCEAAPSALMGVTARIAGRVLFLGITDDGRIIAHVLHPNHPASGPALALTSKPLGVFSDISGHLPGGKDPRQAIISAVRTVAAKGWIASVKLDANGNAQPYTARNGAGYTLEAELGVRPNGNAEPDYCGWEVKQYGVRDMVNRRAKGVVTLLTPEPDGGLYNADLPAFMLTYGYPDQNGIADRVNFGGIYKVGVAAHRLTRLKMEMSGFDPATGKIDAAGGEVRLVDPNAFVAASWSFDKLLQHWQTKHARAAYVPSVKRGPPPEYRFSDRATLFVGTDFILLLKGLAAGRVYLDPAQNATIIGGVVHGSIHRRCQFRVKHRDLSALYQNEELIPAP